MRSPLACGVRGLTALALLTILAAPSGCGDADTTSLGGNPSCPNANWRAATPGAVICPGAPDCSCPTGQICCIRVENNKATNGSCGALADCAGPTLVCDGNEDCATGEVCCLVDRVGGGSSCRQPQDCFFNDELKLCRDDVECDGLKHCEPSMPGSYLGGLVAACVP